MTPLKAADLFTVPPCFRNMVVLKDEPGGIVMGPTPEFVAFLDVVREFLDDPYCDPIHDAWAKRIRPLLDAIDERTEGMRSSAV